MTKSILTYTVNIVCYLTVLFAEVSFFGKAKLYKNYMNAYCDLNVEVMEKSEIILYVFC